MQRMSGRTLQFGGMVKEKEVRGVFEAKSKSKHIDLRRTACHTSCLTASNFPLVAQFDIWLNSLDRSAAGIGV